MSRFAQHFTTTSSASKLQNHLSKSNCCIRLAGGKRLIELSGDSAIAVKYNFESLGVDLSIYKVWDRLVFEEITGRRNNFTPIYWRWSCMETEWESGSWNGPASTSNIVLYRVHANRTRSSNQIADLNTHAIPETDTAPACTLPFSTPLPNVQDEFILPQMNSGTFDLMEIHVKNLPQNSTHHEDESPKRHSTGALYIPIIFQLLFHNPDDCLFEIGRNYPQLSNEKYIYVEYP
ncbi:hypothetical protein WN51_12357 [Melipona quadrifasciata]|uniref:Uncharacterized protein n=1 Tax=Melipona quadrifasciata TaxID=166423 RepID=A0A0M9A2L0_9HYME|nr:hypothetical protein WN51_12357 [Melipona quadrifasciata]